MRATLSSVCPHDCPSQCALQVTVEAGRITDVAGDSRHPFTRGVICGKVHDYAERVYGPTRVLTPLRRVGPKGEGRFEPIGWDQALSLIHERFTAIIAEHGIPIKVFIMNNGYLGMVRQWQELFWDGRYSHVEMGQSPDYVKLAEAYGATGLRFEDKHTLVEDMRQALNTDGPVLVDVRVTKEENTYPMIPAGQAARDMVG